MNQINITFVYYYREKDSEVFMKRQMASTLLLAVLISSFAFINESVAYGRYYRGNNSNKQYYQAQNNYVNGINQYNYNYKRQYPVNYNQPAQYTYTSYAAPQYSNQQYVSQPQTGYFTTLEQLNRQQSYQQNYSNRHHH